MSAYELAQFISQNNVDRLLKISTPAIYKSCKRLYAAGLISAAVSKDGGLPEKTTYTLNQSGEKRFFELLEGLSGSFMPPYLDCNVLVWNLDRIEYTQGVAMLRRLQEAITGFYEWILQHEKTTASDLPFGQRAIVKQYRITVEALLRWAEETLNEYKELNKESK